MGSHLVFHSGPSPTPFKAETVQGVVVYRLRLISNTQDPVPNLPAPQPESESELNPEAPGAYSITYAEGCCIRAFLAIFA